jgi:hypothetical protein
MPYYRRAYPITLQAVRAYSTLWRAILKEWSPSAIDHVRRRFDFTGARPLSELASVSPTKGQPGGTGGFVYNPIIDAKSAITFWMETRPSP